MTSEKFIDPLIPAVAAIALGPLGVVAAFFIGQTYMRGIDDHIRFLLSAYWIVFLSSILMVALAFGSLHIRRTFFGYVAFGVSFVYSVLLGTLGVGVWFFARAHG